LFIENILTAGQKHRATYRHTETHRDIQRHTQTHAHKQSQLQSV